MLIKIKNQESLTLKYIIFIFFQNPGINIMWLISAKMSKQDLKNKPKYNPNIKVIMAFSYV